MPWLIRFPMNASPAVRAPASALLVAFPRVTASTLSTQMSVWNAEPAQAYVLLVLPLLNNQKFVSQSGALAPLL